jgi:hypothetical protein
VMMAEIMLAVLPPIPAPSKMTSSVAPGTEALSCTPEAVPQFVGAVAFQFELLPFPTQYLVAMLPYFIFKIICIIFSFPIYSCVTSYTQGV